MESKEIHLVSSFDQKGWTALPAFYTLRGATVSALQQTIFFKGVSLSAK